MIPSTLLAPLSVAPAGLPPGIVATTPARQSAYSRFVAPVRAAFVASPVVFETELADWITTTLKVNCYQGQLPQDDTAYPLLTFVVIDANPTMRLLGAAGNGSALVQFDAWGLSPNDTNLLKVRLFNALAGYRGPAGRLAIQGANPGRVMTGAEVPFEGSQYKVSRAMQEYEIWYEIPIPVR